MAISFNIMVHAQDKSPFHFSLNHFSLSVKDVNKSADFYSRILNLEEITNRTKVEGIRWFSLGDGKELHLISTLKEGFVVNKAIHMGLTLSNFDEFVQKLNLMKIAYSDWPGNDHHISVRADGIKQVYIQDPDGYWIEINSVGQK